MWIRSQNRKCLIKCGNFYIDEKYGKEEPIYWILGFDEYCSKEEEDSFLLGVYNSLSTALNILDRIQYHIEAKTTVYQMPLNEEN